MKILVAMSGGVDSSVAAARLVAAGHDVVGATLKLWGGSSDSGCCTVADVDDARRVAQILGIDHHVFNYTEEFERAVVDPYVRDTMAGRSPNPCIECNRHVKFDLLFERARRLGFDAVATGHHARVLDRGGERVLARGADALKDQSYVLAYLGADRLSTLVLPIGDLSKSEVREEARRAGLRTFDKPDSQDVCFIEASRGREAFFAPRAALSPAAIVDGRTGDTVGHTDAAELFTVGQRRGVLPGPGGERRYVRRIDLARGRIEVAPLDDILVTCVALDGSPVITRPLVDGQRVLAQTSAHGEVAAAVLRATGGWRVDFAEPRRPVAAGQSVVLYDDDNEVVIGAAVAGAGVP